MLAMILSVMFFLGLCLMFRVAKFFRFTGFPEIPVGRYLNSLLVPS
jgi:hypothetical protein